MNELLLKQISVLSALAGAALAVLSLIPYINLFAFCALVLCLSAIILVYMKKLNMIGIIDLREGAIFGAIIGFISFIAFSIIYIPLSIVLGWILSSFHVSLPSIFPYFFSSFGSFIVMIMLIIFIALLSGLMNGFAGLSTAYVYEILSGIKKEENERFDIEIK